MKKQKHMICILGDDSVLIEKKWLADFQKKNQDATFLRYDLTIDQIEPSRLLSQYYSNSIFESRYVFLFRNLDSQLDKLEIFLNEVIEKPVSDRPIVIITPKINKTTKVGKLIRDFFQVEEFDLPEIKPFDLLDALNNKNTAKVLQQSSKLEASGHEPLGLFSLLCNHFFLMKRVKALENRSADMIARELGEHQFRIQKMLVATRYWTARDIDTALYKLSATGDRIRTWQFDPQVLVNMLLINLCL